MTPPRFLDAGETALVVEFGSVIDPAINARVLALDDALSRAAVSGVVELVPTYRSLMIHYDPLILPRAELLVAAAACLNAPLPIASPHRIWTLPACYEGEFSEDLEHVARQTGLTAAQVITAHARAQYTVYMYGFAPGWAYLGGLPPQLALPRRAAPRARIPPGSLIIAAGQAIVSTMAMPSGWHILGRTPERLFRPETDPAFWLAVGDRVTFEPVDRAQFDALQDRARSGEILSRSMPL